MVIHTVEMWSYSLATSSWAKVSGTIANNNIAGVASSTLPWPTFGRSASYYDPTRRQFILFGGFDNNPTYTCSNSGCSVTMYVTNALWSYDPLSDRWTSLRDGQKDYALSGSIDEESSLYMPLSRTQPLVFAQSDQVYVFGGRFSGSSLAQDQLWRYNRTSGNWAYLGTTDPAKNQPIGRQAAAVAVDYQGQFVYVHGGVSSANALINDLWAWKFDYTPATTTTTTTTMTTTTTTTTVVAITTTQVASSTLSTDESMTTTDLIYTTTKPVTSSLVMSSMNSYVVSSSPGLVFSTAETTRSTETVSPPYTSHADVTSQAMVFSTTATPITTATMTTSARRMGTTTVSTAARQSPRSTTTTRELPVVIQTAWLLLSPSSVPINEVSSSTILKASATTTTVTPDVQPGPPREGSSTDFLKLLGGKLLYVVMLCAGFLVVGMALVGYRVYAASHRRGGGHHRRAAKTNSTAAAPPTVSTPPLSRTGFARSTDATVPDRNWVYRPAWEDQQSSSSVNANIQPSAPYSDDERTAVRGYDQHSTAVRGYGHHQHHHQHHHHRRQHSATAVRGYGREVPEYDQGAVPGYYDDRQQLQLQVEEAQPNDSSQRHQAYATFDQVDPTTAMPHAGAVFQYQDLYAPASTLQQYNHMHEQDIAALPPYAVVEDGPTSLVSRTNDNDTVPLYSTALMYHQNNTG